MACGDRYRDLLRVGGQTADDPVSLWCNEADAQMWFGQARHVFGLQRAAWNALIKIENERGEWPQTDALRASTTAFEEGFDQLPEPSIFMAFGAFDCAEAVQQYIGSIKQGACVLEQLNDALEGYGAKGVSPGAGQPGWFSRWGGWLVAGVAVLGAGGALYWAYAPRAEASPKRGARPRQAIRP